MQYAVSVDGIECAVTARELEALIFRLERNGVVRNGWRSPSAAAAESLRAQRDAGKTVLKVAPELQGTLLEALQRWAGAEDFSERLAGLRTALYPDVAAEAA
jgi:hypothetical protein